MEEEIAKQLAIAIALNCVRNTSIEDLHAGVTPVSYTGDNSDITILTELDSIPWQNLSRINDDEMKAFMIEVVNKIYTALMNLEDPKFINKFITHARQSTIRWNEPQYLENWFKKPSEF